VSLLKWVVDSELVVGALVVQDSLQKHLKFPDSRPKDFAYSPKFLQLFHEDFGYESCHHSTPGMEIFSPELETSLFRLDFQLPVDIVGLRG
jgi:hypothetical protein